MKLYQKISSLISARNNCLKDSNSEWYEKHTEKIEELTKEHFPSGSGFDGFYSLSLESSTPERLVFFCEYHHMNENGYYDGWSTLKVIVRPSLQFGFTFKLTGIQRKYSIDRDYFGDIINDFLDKEV